MRQVKALVGTLALKVYSHQGQVTSEEIKL